MVGQVARRTRGDDRPWQLRDHSGLGALGSARCLAVTGQNFLELIDSLLQRLITTLHIQMQAIGPGRSLLLRLGQALFEVMRQIAQVRLAGQTGTSLERVKDAQHLAELPSVRCRAVKAAQGSVQLLEQFVGFLDEDVQNLRFGSCIRLAGGTQRDRAWLAQLLLRVETEVPNRLDVGAPVRDGSAVA